jgi:hypothetical protein
MYNAAGAAIGGLGTRIFLTVKLTNPKSKVRVGLGSKWCDNWCDNEVIWFSEVWEQLEA